MGNKIAVVRVRGRLNVKKVINDTLDMLRLHNKNYCVFLEKNPVNLGMLHKVKDFVTFGEVDDGLFDEVLQKRGEEYKGREADSKGKIKYTRRFYSVDKKKFKKYFRLSPPIKGFGRKGIKKAFSLGGALGNRKEQMADLIRRMI